MNSINFVKNGEKKNTLKDFKMILISGYDEDDGSKVFEFIMRYADTSITARLNELKEVIVSPVDAYYDDKEASIIKANWTVRNLGPIAGSSSVGDKIILSYKTPLKEKEVIKEEKVITKENKNNKHENKKENKVKLEVKAEDNKENTVEGVE